MKFIVFLFSSIVYANSFYNVKYNVIENDNDEITSYTSELFCNNSKSVYYTYTKTLDLNSVKYDEESSSIVGNKIDAVYEVFKNKDNDLVYSNSQIWGQRTLTQIDFLGDLKWELSDDKKEILGYKCNSAKLNYRGRDYVVYYTKDIPIDGPWKFYNAPGLILLVHEKTNRINIEATEISETKSYDLNTTLDIINSLSWNELINLSKNKYAKVNEDLSKKGTGSVTINTSSYLEVWDINEQNQYEVTYQNFNKLFLEEKGGKEEFETIKTEYKLISNNFESQYEYVDKLLNIPEGVTSFGFTSRYGILYKNFKENRYLDNKEIDNQYFIVKDSIPNFKWNILYSQQDVILNKKLTKAITNFKGFYITAWFTYEIPIMNGPDLYSKLPGLILRMEIKDTKSKSNETSYFEAIELKKVNNIKIQKPKKGKEISSSEYENIQEERREKIREMIGGGVDTD